MPARVISRFLLRAPLLPGSAASLDDSPLGALAVELASPSLATAPDGERKAAALRRYAARARFRPTPAGLLAGVGVGRIGARTRVDTGAPAAHVTVTWARLASLTRALLDDPAARAETHLRAAPSLLRHGDHAMWLGPSGEALETEVDDELEGLLAAGWTPWPRLAALAGDDTLLALVDDGLLVSDLVPPLIGPPPLSTLLQRLGALRSRAGRRVHQLLDRAARHLAATPPRVDAARGLLGPDALHATLVFPEAAATLDEDTVARAVALVPTLVRLAAALVPPTAERDLDPSIADAVAAAAELCGPGAYDLAALALGGYGVRPGEPPPPPTTAPPAGLLELLCDGLAGDELRLDAAALDALLPPAPIPDTVELVLAPRATPDGWLLGLHAPAGATWGRFAHALGAPLARALAELARSEPPGRLDVDFTPAAELADLAAHPPVRKRALALSSWPARGAVPPTDLRVSGPPPVELHGGTPSGLTRLRSTLAPPGVYQLLCGWSLHRQHAPWALTWGALARQARLPRVVLDGFVISPTSWRLPDGDLAEWRRRHRVPRHVQVGHEDELLLVDLDAPGAVDELRRAGGRVHEIWPPLDDPPVDRSGRRVEAVVAVIGPDARAPSPIAAAPAPVPAPGWRTFRIFGPRDRQDRVLVEAVAPSIAAARAAGEIDGWFFLRYLEGRRHHLRVRARGDLAARLETALVPARTAGDVVTVETAPYHRELARYGDAMPAVESIFQQDSDATVDLLSRDADPDETAVAHIDALAAGLGLDLRARAALAADLRAAHEPYPAEAAADFRRRARSLRAALTAIRPAPRPPVPSPLIPVLLHLAINRLLGTDADQEGRIVYLWQRTLEGLEATDTRGPRRRSGRR